MTEGVQTAIVRTITLLCLALMPVLAQEVTWLGAHSGRIIRDAEGNWLIVDKVEQAAGNSDLRVQKLTPDLQTTLWKRLVGGSGSEEVVSLLSDSSGALLVLGNTSSKDFPVTEGVLAATPPSDPGSAFLVKLDSAGNLGFSTYLNDGNSTRGEKLLQVSGDHIVLALTGRLWQVDLHGTRVMAETASQWIGGPMVLDNYGKLWVGGTSWSDDLPVTPGAFQMARQSGACYTPTGPGACPTGFVMRLDSVTGAIEAATYLGGTSPVFVSAVAVHSDGSPVVTGNVQGGSSDGDF
ncbi:MAG: hypothetical protein HYZ57_00400, partial [Acidobacteria bacterium]|nr:hypothetical protein [Acidobacteriota bacterium]